MLLVILEVIWGLVFAMFYAVYNAIRNFFPDNFSKSIEGETVLITGGGSGIGRIISRKLASLGATVVTLDVNEKGNDETVR
jgi:all-trans-retinol dehydrogenase (NAD+)